MSKRLAIAAAVVIALSAVGSAAFAFRGAIRDAVFAAAKPPLPPAQKYVPEPSVAPPAEPQANPTAKPQAPAPKPPAKPEAVKPPYLPAEMNLAVPFTPQAPHADWGLPYQEACEEASLVMLKGFYDGTASFTPDAADWSILAIVDWEKKTFGYYEDTTAEEVARIAREDLGLADAHVLPVASIDDVKREVAKSRPVLVPAAGRLLQNPYFSGQGPLYHMLLIKGYTKDGKIITNDPGTRRGADYVYDPAVLFGAIHDWNGGDVENGAKVMIVVGK